VVCSSCVTCFELIVFAFGGVNLIGSYYVKVFRNMKLKFARLVILDNNSQEVIS
jgi:hypothetical protein